MIELLNFPGNLLSLCFFQLFHESLPGAQPPGLPRSSGSLIPRPSRQEILPCLHPSTTPHFHNYLLPPDRRPMVPGSVPQPLGAGALSLPRTAKCHVVDKDACGRRGSRPHTRQSLPLAWRSEPFAFFIALPQTLYKSPFHLIWDLGVF